MSHMLSLGQAARLAGVGKTTLTRAIKAGRMSAGRRADGGYEIDAAELARCYPFAVVTPETVTRDGDAVHCATPEHETPETPRDPDLEVRVAALEAELAGLKALLEAERRRSEEWKATADDWKGQAERLAIAPPARSSSVPAVSASRRGWWPWR